MNSFNFPALPGTYLLLFELASPASVQIGRLGESNFAAGNYVYLGSACGPGGLGGRLRHHLGALRKIHWHIDAFRQVARVTAVIYAVGQPVRECLWSQQLAARADVTIPVLGMGASDCRNGCRSHFYQLQGDPTFLKSEFDGAVFVKIE